MEFNEGGAPEQEGHYWLKIRNTDHHPIQGNHAQGHYSWRCGCHPDEYQGLSDRIKKSLNNKYCEVVGWIKLPDPST